MKQKQFRTKRKQREVEEKEKEQIEEKHNTRPFMIQLFSFDTLFQILVSDKKFTNTQINSCETFVYSKLVSTKKMYKPNTASTSGQVACLIRFSNPSSTLPNGIN